MNPIDFNELADFSNRSELEKAIAALETLMRTFEGLKTVVVKTTNVTKERKFVR